MTDINIINQNKLKAFIKDEASFVMKRIIKDIDLLFERASALDDRVSVLESKIAAKNNGLKLK